MNRVILPKLTSIFLLLLLICGTDAFDDISDVNANFFDVDSLTKPVTMSDGWWI